MATSTTNLLSAVNSVLQNVGERQVSTLVSPLSNIVASNLRESCYHVSTMSEWTFLKLILPAQSWLFDTAYLGDFVQAIHNVEQGSNSTGFTNLSYVAPDVYDSRPLMTFDDTQLQGSRWYNITNDLNRVRINPYPTGSIGQSQLRFYVTTTIVPPNASTDFFPVPERFLPLIVKHATALTLLRHLGDTATAQFENQLFTQMAEQIKQRERGVVAGRQNMYKPHRGMR